jgi:hypothetical protein
MLCTSIPIQVQPLACFVRASTTVFSRAYACALACACMHLHVTHTLHACQSVCVCALPIPLLMSQHDTRIAVALARQGERMFAAESPGNETRGSKVTADGNLGELAYIIAFLGYVLCIYFGPVYT